MAAPNVNGRLELTGVHQKPPASLETRLPWKFDNAFYIHQTQKLLCWKAKLSLEFLFGSILKVKI